jgi:hypothetical protein
LAIEVGHGRKRDSLAWGFKSSGQSTARNRADPQCCGKFQRSFVNRREHPDSRMLHLLTHRANRETPVLCDLTFKICAFVVQRTEPPQQQLVTATIKPRRRASSQVPRAFSG